MANTPEQFEPYERTHEYVEALLHGHKPGPWTDISQQDAEVLRIAAELNTVGAAPRPRPQFVAELAAELEEVSESRSRRLWQLSRRKLLRGIAGIAGLLLEAERPARAPLRAGSREP